MEIKEYFLRNVEWILLVIGIISIAYELLEFFVSNPQEYTGSEALKQVPMGFFAFTLLFYIIRILKGFERRM